MLSRRLEFSAQLKYPQHNSARQKSRRNVGRLASQPRDPSVAGRMRPSRAPASTGSGHSTMADAAVTTRPVSRAFDRAADLEALTHRIYDAALGEDCWRAVLMRLADAFGAESAVLVRPVRPMNDDAIVPVRTDPTAL